MRVLIVYDSIFGNTEKVALALKNGVKEPHTVQMVKVDAFSSTLLAGVDLLLVGSPTRGFRPTGAISAMLKELSQDALVGIKVAAFDTRISMKETNSKFLKVMASLFGYAAEPISKALVKHGGTLASETHWFIVGDKEGPLREGELEHAQTWMIQLIGV